MDRLLRGAQRGARGDRLAAPEIAREARVRAARDLDAEPVALAEALRRGPERDAHAPHTVGAARAAPRRDALEAVANVRRASARVDVAEPHEDVEMARGRRHADLGRDFADHVDVALEHVARE